MTRGVSLSDGLRASQVRHDSLGISVLPSKGHASRAAAPWILFLRMFFFWLMENTPWYHGIYGDLTGFYSDLMWFYSVLWDIYSDLMGFYSDLMGY